MAKKRAIRQEQPTTIGEVEIGEPISHDTEVWVAIGGKLLEESLLVGREYAKFMIQFSFSAIPIYISLLGLVGKGAMFVSGLSFGKILIILAPVILFIISSLLFVWAYYPKSGQVLVNVIETIQNTHQKTINRRRRINLVATLLFAVAVLMSAGILLVANH